MHRRALLIAAFATGCSPLAPPVPDTPGGRLLTAARRQKSVTKRYDAAYQRIAYPGGDVPRATGACSDVIIRAARDGLGVDLQQLVHEDMRQAFKTYPRTWGMAAPDANIDHRRVPNLETYWRRHGAQLWSGKAESFPLPLEPGDILTFRSWWNRPHIALVAHGGLHVRIVHNMGDGVREESLWTKLALEPHGHYRWPRAG